MSEQPDGPQENGPQADHEIGYLQDDQTLPPRPEEEVADATRDG